MSDPVRYLLDTSALLAHYRLEGGWDAVQSLFEGEGTEVLLASVSLTEFGRRMRELGAAAHEVDETLTGYELVLSGVVAIDAAVARAAVVIAARTPVRLPLADALIAAAARSCDAVLVHRDAHMRAIPSDLVRQTEILSGPTN
jgi:predicted nucleic acid-binding protein